MGSLTPCSDFLDSQENPLLVGVVTCGGVCEWVCGCVSLYSPQSLQSQHERMLQRLVS